MLRAIAHGLRLDEFQEAHLLDLAAAQRRRPPARPRRTAERVDADLAGLLQASVAVPALIAGRTGDILAWNGMGHGLFAPHLDPRAIEDVRNRPNTARIVFLDPASRDFFVNWSEKATAMVAHLRMAAGRHPEDAALAELIGELCMKSPEFSRLWAGSDVRPCGVMALHLRHPTVGEIVVVQQTLTRTSSGDQSLVIATAGPDPSSAAALSMLRRLDTSAAS